MVRQGFRPFFANGVRELAAISGIGLAVAFGYCGSDGQPEKSFSGVGAALAGGQDPQRDDLDGGSPNGIQ